MKSNRWSSGHLFLLIYVTLILSSYSEENWSQFRGPHGMGHSLAKDTPLKWSSEAVAWKVPLKGKGQSSPVSWGNKIFLTGGSDNGRERYLYCLDSRNGKLLWSRTIACSSPEKPHRMNSYATPTCATDGERVVAFFGPAGLHCYTLEGEKIWSRQLGNFPGPWGVAASPVIVDNMVVQNCDAEGASSLVAFDLSSGEVLWQTARKNKPRGGWSTPVLIETGAKRELVLNGEFGVRAYDPAKGRELWFCEGFNGRGSPIPAFSNGLLYVVNGKPGDTYAVKPGGSGNVTKSRMAWHAPRRGGRDLPSPAVVGDFLVVVSMSGLATCYDTG
ncbi:MAG: PQQ-binding-like beta-propeller repeat protein, partial [Roseibacillus sp.]|nr:PQQ-binding-like beta-propeller repeat protein [Roseibacillus sp.]